ncbi:MAG: deoxyribodipyrimidine photolyase [Spirochaetaceae bacterium]|nr:MAG: deoxyribodipyrimidine photolyase [Spirochaetaceae bacterium]
MSVHPDRLVFHAKGEPRRNARYVLYWMQSAQRPWDNAALDYAVTRANELGLPLLVVFGLMSDYPEANVRHYRFMLEGLSQTASHLKRHGIGFRLRSGSPPAVAAAFAAYAALVVSDGAYLRHTRAWREQLARDAGCPVVEVDSELVVPVRRASDKREFAARTIRPKLHRQVDEFLQEQPQPTITVAWNEQTDLEADASLYRRDSKPNDHVTEADLADVQALCARLPLDTSVHEVSRLFSGGPEHARSRFEAFLDDRFVHYSDHRNQPHTDDSSGMSMHLQFGQVSPLRLLLEAKKHLDSCGGSLKEQYEDFFEELLVRRELAYNYCFYEPNYDSYDALPGWAKQTLSAHAHDERKPLYSLEELRASQTEDEYWNAANTEMRETGYMHNYMRMYWGKQIILWSPTPEEAFSRVLYLNNRFFLDGRNPASYANCAWIFGLHDRPWTEREVFGKVRIMVPAGLKRKCNMPAYLEKVDRLSRFIHETSA